MGVGALVGALATGWVADVRRQGRAVVIAVVVWGASITAFGLVKSLPVALVLLAVAGWADVVSAVFRNMILQLRVPDRLRGRMNAIQVAVVSGGRGWATLSLVASRRPSLPASLLSQAGSPASWPQ